MVVKSPRGPAAALSFQAAAHQWMPRPCRCMLSVKQSKRMLTSGCPGTGLVVPYLQGGHGSVVAESIPAAQDAGTIMCSQPFSPTTHLVVVRCVDHGEARALQVVAEPRILVVLAGAADAQVGAGGRLWTQRQRAARHGQQAQGHPQAHYLGRLLAQGSPLSGWCWERVVGRSGKAAVLLNLLVSLIDQHKQHCQARMRNPGALGRPSPHLLVRSSQRPLSAFESLRQTRKASLYPAGERQASERKAGGRLSQQA